MEDITMLRLNFAKYSALVCAMAFEAWWLLDMKQSAFNWSAATGFMAALISFVGIEYSTQGKMSAVYKEGDGVLFKELMTVLPMHVIQFLKTHDFRGSYLTERLTPLIVYRRTWDDALHVFNDKTIEKRSRAFHEVVTKFIDDVACRTHPVYTDSQSVYPHGENYVEDPDEQNRIESSIRILNDSADDVVVKHTRLIGVCRKRLPRTSANAVSSIS